MNNTDCKSKTRSSQWLGVSGLLMALMFTLPACAGKTGVQPAPVHDNLAEAAQEDQADVMKTCQVNATAMNLQGDTREYYLNGCLLAPPQTHAAHKQCQVNATAMNLEGDTRRHYLLSCLARH
ncbi:PsiF family protein [Methylobacillus glycogenes]|uniref:PsiF family protein n=1 Tax=Methylobacillus glycogenes TaxID=406 RepID=UPI0011DCE2AC|nr:PsiF family protein [Methylobacillus glycogenes]